MAKAIKELSFENSMTLKLLKIRTNVFFIEFCSKSVNWNERVPGKNDAIEWAFLCHALSQDISSIYPIL